MKAYVEYEVTLTGDILRVSPLSSAVHRQVVRAAEDEFAFDESAFEKPLENSAVPGDTYIDRDSTEYKRAYNQHQREINDWYLTQLYTLAVSADNQDELVDEYRGELAQVRQIRKDDMTDWVAVLRYFVLAHEPDEKAVLDIITGKAELSDAEISDKVRIFRTNV